MMAQARHPAAGGGSDPTLHCPEPRRGPPLAVPAARRSRRPCA
ncbi:hypothetical protein ISF6_0312 [Piscinibacter sakaiensis]|uniref:Uncharacterized protein n=1 Tax=Piscinibacter sakaiensis TaxID=1547922 RepID=A0A0K8NX17_PISS1|nr:hypothetical protein ISF6_0312 [Piscinibacter sakaiensis]